MDIDYFLNERTKFIRYFCDNSMSPFLEIKKCIEDGNKPYEPTPFYENEEPEYLDEWLEADMGLSAVSHACISMLSSSLHLFLKSWFNRLTQYHKMQFEFNFKRNGWFKEYIRVLKELETPLEECGVNIEILEQVALARNRIQHPEHITDINISHSEYDIKKYPNPFFIHEIEACKTEDEEASFSHWNPPTITASQEKIYEAIKNVEIFSTWLESQYWASRNA